MVRRTTPEKLQGVPGDLPDAELEVLACLWRGGPATAREVREAMAPYRAMTHGAMSTLLKRLEAKGLVSKQKGSVGKAFLYRAESRAEPTYRRIVRDLHERIFGGSRLTMFASLFDSPPPTEEELVELEAFLDQMKKKRATKENGR